MFARLLRQWFPWRKPRPAIAGAHADFFTPGDLAADEVPAIGLAKLGDPALRTRIERILDRGNEGDWAAAKQELHALCAEQPDFALPFALMGVVLERSVESGLADAAYANARRLDSDSPAEKSLGEHFHRRGRHYLRLRLTDEASRCLLLAHRMCPDSAGPLEMLGIAGYYSGDVEAGRRWLDMAIERAAEPQRGALRINRLIFTIPQIYRSAAELHETRARLEREIDALLASPPRLEDPSRAVDATPFFLCFQGYNDRQLNSRFAGLLLRSCPALAYTAAHAVNPAGTAGRKPRIGFVSAFLREHSVGAWYSELIRRLIESGRFETALFTDGEVDAGLRETAARLGRHVALHASVPEARAQIEAERLDMLVYTDVALNRLLYCLAFSRLAPLQTLLVGHPCTSGIPSIDYFISNVFQDTEAAQSHYSEQLVRLSTIPVYVRKTAPPARRMSRAELGLATDRRYYICPMLLQKFHPDFDAAMAAILRADDGGEMVLFEDPRKPHWREELEARFAKDIPDVAGRIGFQPLAPKEVFLNLLLSADCLLDPFHFSGGVTTYIEFSLGLPVVTLPGELFRSRMTAGIYAQAGVSDCIARDPGHYVELALRLARDAAFRSQVSQKILNANGRIFEARAGVDALAEWIESACENGAPTSKRATPAST